MMPVIMIEKFGDKNWAQESNVENKFFAFQFIFSLAKTFFRFYLVLGTSSN